MVIAQKNIVESDIMEHLNFRDLGGIKTTCGKTVRSKRLLRAALPAGLRDDELAVLLAHNLKYIVDLRTLHEVTSEPADSIDGVAYKHIDIMGDNIAQAASAAYWMKVFHEKPESTEEEFRQTYREFATSAHSTAGYASLLKLAVESDDGAILFHCTAGKDRTGFAAAIILKILGVSDEDIFADYLRTAEYQKHIAQKYIERAKNAGFSDAQISAMEDIFGVKLSYLTTAFDALEKTHGSFENYAAIGLGVTEEIVAELKRKFLE